MHLPARARRVVALLSLSIAASFTTAAQPPVRVGTVVAAGSAVRDDNHTVWARIVGAAGGPGACVAVFTAPAADPDGAARDIGASLRARGVTPVHIRVGPGIAGQDLVAAVRDAQWVDAVQRCGGVYFSGGEQSKLLDLLLPAGKSTPLLDAVRGVFARGGVVAGESAGNAVMSDPAFRDLPQPLRALKGEFEEGRDVGRGFGFLPAGVLIDQHFLARGRIGRLLPVMQRLKQPLGLGVEEGTAAVVRGDTLEVLGVRGVVVVDLSNATSDEKLGAFNLKGARLAYLTAGDTMDLKTRAVTPAAAKRSRLVDPNVEGFTGRFDHSGLHPDILAKDAIVHAMTLLLDSARRESVGLAFAATPLPGDAKPTLGFEWRFYKRPTTRGWSSPASGGEHTVVDIGLDIRPVTMNLPLYR
jgi:cyanophycinase